MSEKVKCLPVSLTTTNTHGVPESDTDTDESWLQVAGVITSAFVSGQKLWVLRRSINLT